MFKVVIKKKDAPLKPLALSMQRSTSLGQRNISLSISNRPERLLINRVAAEFIAIYKKKPNATQNALSVLRKDIRSNYALL